MEPQAGRRASSPRPLQKSLGDIERSLFERYGGEAFMYVEYPHKRFWRREVGDARCREALRQTLGARPPLLFYVHMPYCHTQCLFCTCHVEISLRYEDVLAYMELLYREIDLLRGFLDEEGLTLDVREIHLGGGSPTYIKEPEFDRLVDQLGSIVALDRLDEFAIEIDPRRIKEDRMRYYHSKGINRVSFGVQDFDIEVQKAINRVQPASLTARFLTSEVRALFPNGVNFDILCGLPRQTTESMRRTMEQVVALAPDRVCLNTMHFSPRFHPHQLEMPHATIPDAFGKKQLFAVGLEVLERGGYERVGYDHFARSSDQVARACKDGRMQWNRLGVTPGRYSSIIGAGVSSTSTVGARYYCQNHYELPEYAAAIDARRLPVFAEHVLDDDDVVRREVIESLRSYFRLDFAAIEAGHGIAVQDYFAAELDDLDEFIRNGVLERRERSIEITELGQQFANLVCSCFDRYRRQPAAAVRTG